METGGGGEYKCVQRSWAVGDERREKIGIREASGGRERGRRYTL